MPEQRAGLRPPSQVGFTGSRHMTDGMRRFIEEAIDSLSIDVIVITGGCIGVDAYVASYARNRGLPVHTVVPADRKLVHGMWRATCTSFEEMPYGTSYRDRNQRMVDLSDRMYGVPRFPANHPNSQRGSGTWMTIRIALRRGVPIEIYKEE